MTNWFDEKMGLHVTARRGPGRPPKGDEAKRERFMTRIRGNLKQRLLAAAAENGRSLSEEIEWRLEHSFEDRIPGAGFEIVRDTGGVWGIRQSA